MEQIIQLIVNNGLGVASFGALLYFIDKYLSKINTTLGAISTTLEIVQENLKGLSSRVDEIEKNTKKKGSK